MVYTRTRHSSIVERGKRVLIDGTRCLFISRETLIAANCFIPFSRRQIFQSSFPGDILSFAARVYTTATQLSTFSTKRTIIDVNFARGRRENISIVVVVVTKILENETLVNQYIFDTSYGNGSSVQKCRPSIKTDISLGRRTRIFYGPPNRLRLTIVRVFTSAVLNVLKTINIIAVEQFDRCVRSSIG